MNTVIIIGIIGCILTAISTVVYYIWEAHQYNKKELNKIKSEYSRKIDKIEGEKCSAKREIVDKSGGNITGFIKAKLEEITTIKNTEKQQCYKERDDKLAYNSTFKATIDRSWENINKSYILKITGALLMLLVGGNIYFIQKQDYSNKTTNEIQAGRLNKPIFVTGNNNAVEVNEINKDQTATAKDTAVNVNNAGNGNTIQTIIYDKKIETEEARAAIIDALNKEYDNAIRNINSRIEEAKDKYEKIKEVFARRGTLQSTEYLRTQKKQLQQLESNLIKEINEFDIKINTNYIAVHSIKISSIEKYEEYKSNQKEAESAFVELKKQWNREKEQFKISDQYVKPFIIQ